MKTKSPHRQSHITVRYAAIDSQNNTKIREMEINNDILSDIVLYSTVPVTLDVLSHFTPLKAYDQSTFRRKAIKETMGVVMNDDVVAKAHGGWYAYYLSVNRTFYGRELVVTLDKHGIRKGSNTICATGVIFVAFAAAFRQDVYSMNMTHRIPYPDYPTRITQKHDMGISHHGRKLGNINRKIRKLSSGVCTHSFAIDEYGDLWEITIIGDAKQPRRMTCGLGIVDILPWGYNDSLVLTRDGDILYISHDGIIDREVLLGTDIVQLYTERVILRDGSVVDYALHWRGKPLAPLFRFKDVNPIEPSIDPLGRTTLTTSRIIKDHPRSAVDYSKESIVSAQMAAARAFSKGRMIISIIDL